MQKNSGIVDVPILVVGGGPIGLGLAIDLGWRGVPCEVLEEFDGSVDHPRLGVILTRTMELCRRWGIVDRIYHCGFNNDYHLDVVYATSMTGYQLGRDVNESCNEMQPPPQSPVKRQRCPQIWFNPILEKAAAEYKTNTISHFRKLESFIDRGDHVESVVLDTQTQQRHTYRSQYLIGCDGAASSVRSALGIEMQGNPVLSYSVNIFIRSKELLSMHDKGEAERYIFVGPKGTWANLTVVDGRELWRITIIGSEQMMDLETLDAKSLVQQCLGTDTIPFEILSIKPWRRTELTASSFRKGRVFLAGDAAHTMSPTGGHGMNTGISDSADLGWKLQAVLEGWGGPGLLDAYELERKPIAKVVVSASAKNFRAWTSSSDCADILEDSAEGAKTRERIGKHMLAAGREDWDSLGLQIGFRYDDSPLCIPDGTPPPPMTVIDYVQTARPGSRAPHAWLADGRSTLDLFGRGFVLLRFRPGVSTDAIELTAQEQGIPLTVLDITEAHVAELYARALVLVRPDGFVAWRGDEAPESPEELMARVSGHVHAKALA